jgi:NADH-quinone oxidoreductase subunit L
MGGEQDIRKMGGLGNSMHKTRWVFLMGTIAIAGIPPFSGFFSKDEILSSVFVHSIPFWIIAMIGAMMTAFYMFRLYFLIFSGKFRGTMVQKQQLHESPSIMIIPLVILAILSIAGGVINLPGFTGGSARLQSFLAPVFAGSMPFLKAPVYAFDHYTEWLLAGVSVVYVGIMILVAWSRFLKKEPEIREDLVQKFFLPRLISHKYYIDEFYDTLFVRPILSLSKGFHEIIEKKIIDKLVDGIGILVIRAGNTIRYLQSGHVGFYVFMMVAGIIAILLFNLVI